jgi:hypothetical protein
MDVEHGLAGSLAAIDSNVVAVNRALGLDGMAGNIDTPNQGGPFVLSRIKPSWSVANWNQKGVASGDWKTIPDTNNKRVAVKHTFCGRITKWAARLSHIPSLQISLCTIVNTPVRLAAEHSAHLHVRTGRLARRQDWHTGHRCSYTS